MTVSREQIEPTRVQEVELEPVSGRVDLSQLSDEELAVLLQQHVDEAFDILVYRYKDPLLNYLFRFMGSLEVAEDLVQETFVRLYQKRTLYEPVARFSTWLYTIASNLARSELRRPYRRYHVSIVRERDPDVDFELSLRDQEPDPERSADSRLKNERIQEALANLPETFREAVILRDVQGLRYEDICEILGQQIGTVKSRIFRGRSMLKTMLKDIYD